MKSTIVAVVITALTVSVAGLGAKVYMDSKPGSQPPVAAIVPVESAALAVASAPKAAPEKPKITKVTPQYTTVQVPSKSCQMVNQTQMVVP